MARGPQPGTQVGPWTLDECLHRGVSGKVSVWRALHGDEVAVVKLMPASKRDDSYTARRFREELRLVVALRDREGIIPVVHSGDDPFPWFAMQEGRPVVETLRGLDDDARVERVVRGTAEIARTLEQLHRDGIVHRDIKPGNILEYAGRWVLADFGIAREGGPGGGLTSSEKRIGPLNFVPPEALAPAEPVAWGKVDVYELAKTMWVLATGQRWPVPGFQPANALWARMSSYAYHPRLDPLEYLVERCSSHEPADRPTVADLRTELDAWLSPPHQGKAVIMDERLKARLAAAQAAERSRNEDYESFVEDAGRMSRSASELMAGLIGQALGTGLFPTGPHEGGHLVAEVLCLGQVVAGAALVGQAGAPPKRGVLVGGLAIERRRGEVACDVHAAWTIRVSDDPEVLFQETWRFAAGSPSERTAIADAASALSGAWPDAIARLVAAAGF